MISSIFGKTKPINYVILLSFLFILYWFIHLIVFNMTYGIGGLAYHGLVLAILLFSIYVVNFVVQRNQISGTNSYTILFYTILIAVFYKVLLDDKVIFCAFFLLLAIRRLISMRSLKDTKHKIFDASLWIVIASLFYEWAIVFLLAVFLAIYSYEPKNIKNWMVPILAFGAVAVIGLSILYFSDNLAYLKGHYQFGIDLDFFSYWLNSTKFIVYVLAVVISGILALINLGKLGQGRLITMRLLAFILFIGLLITLVNTSEREFPILLTFFPGAVLLSQYIEVIKRVKLREAILVISVVTPFLVMLADFISK